MPPEPDLVASLRGLGGPPAEPGTVYLVGGGPGDPGLLTVRAAVLLASCDAVLHDRLSPPEALELVPEHAERILVGKRYGEPGTSRAEVDALMARLAAEGKAVVRLKGGDPFVFGRGGEEAEALHLVGIPFEVVSGVTSAVAVPGAGGIPVTHRGLSAGFAVITGHEDPDKPGGHVDYTTLGRFPGTLVFLMGVGHVGDIARELIAHGKPADTPVAMIRWGTTPRQRTLRATLGTVAAEVERQRMGSPAVTVVGDVASLGPELAWRERRPLFGRRVLVPRSRNQASALSMRIRALGGDPVEAPTIEILPGDAAAMRDAVTELAAGAYTAVALTSPNGVEAFADALAAAALDARALAAVGTVAAIGPGTSEAMWRALRVRPDLVPDRSTTAAMAAAFPEGSGRVLLPRADIATETLAEGLRERGYQPVAVDAYVTGRPRDLPPGVADDLAAGRIDLVAFASSSTVRNFVDLLGGRPWQARAVSIGPVTSATCRELGIEVAQEADPHDLDGLVAALVAAAAR